MLVRRAQKKVDDGPQFHAVIPYHDGQVVPEGIAVTRV